MKLLASSLSLCTVLAGSSVQAQVLRGSQDVLDHHIIVIGRGVVRVPADVMRLEVRIYPKRGGTSVDDAGMKIADIVRANGVPDARWTLPLLGLLSQNSQGAIMGSIRKPTRDGVESLARRIVAAIPDSLGAGIQSANVSTSLALDDCTRPLEQVEDAAIADARRRAARIAAAAKLELGAIVGVTESGTFAPGCGGEANQVFNMEGPGGTYGALDVTVTETATVEFAAH